MYDVDDADNYKGAVRVRCLSVHKNIHILLLYSIHEAQRSQAQCGAGSVRGHLVLGDFN